MIGLQLVATLMIGFPLLGFLALSVLASRLSHRAAAAIGCSSVIGAAMLAFLGLLHTVAAGGEHQEALGRWFQIGSIEAWYALTLDPLASVMTMVVAGVGALIHLYSIEFMMNEPPREYARFFALMNLFVAAMLCLVLADDLVLLYLGWEGVGVASFLLIGFWYRDPGNVRAARKAFLQTRIGDAALALGIVVLFLELDTIRIGVLLERAEDLPLGSPFAERAALLLSIGAIAKSAQLPLSTWLPDAMAGPTPVSALIHAATMVTAGIYLVARMFPIFAAAPDTLTLIAIAGGSTALYAALCALVETELKRILAYSTMSQLGYMFLALGAAAPAAAIFHLVTHAFFKALLFLVAGAISMSLFGAHDLREMRGLRRIDPWLFWKLTIGAAALSAFPLITSGFYSKELILIAAFGRSPWIGAAAIVIALLTSLYAFRVVWLMWSGGGPRLPPRGGPGFTMKGTITALAAAAIIGGFLGQPLTSFLGGAPGPRASLWVELLGAAASLVGIALAYRLVRSGRVELPFLAPGLGLDALYDRIIVRPLARIVRAAAFDIAELVPMLFTAVASGANRALLISQDGRIRTYAACMAIAAVLLSIMVMFSVS
jgi:NADH-quinone oxidoreductase subunit L